MWAGSALRPPACAQARRSAGAPDAPPCGCALAAMAGSLQLETMRRRSQAQRQLGAGGPPSRREHKRDAWRSHAGARANQSGYALLVVLLVLSVFILGLARVAINWKTAVQRERENRMIDHAREYRTAIKRYFHKYGRYPPDLNALTQKDGFGLRYLRQAWPDPLNTASTSDSAEGQGDGSWQIIHYGQAVTAEIVDQPPAAAASGGTTQGSVISGPKLSASPAPMQPAPSAPGFSTAATGATTLSGAPGSPGSGVGGGPIIGVASRNKQPAVHEFNGFATPNDWEFVYNFALDPSLRAGAPATGAAPGGVRGAGVQPGPGGGPGGGR